MAEDGRTSRQIGRELRVPKNVVERWTAAQRDGRKRDRALRLNDLGRTARQISPRVKVPVAQVQLWINERAAVRLHGLGRSERQIAKELEIPLRDVRKWLAKPTKDASSPRHSGVRHGTETRRCARRMAELRDPITDIAQVIRITPKTVRTWLRTMEQEEGVDLLPGGRVRVHDRAAILADLRAVDEEGRHRFSRAEIRTKYTCSNKFLSQLANGRIDP